MKSPGISGCLKYIVNQEELLIFRVEALVVVGLPLKKHIYKPDNCWETLAAAHKPKARKTTFWCLTSSFLQSFFPNKSISHSFQTGRLAKPDELIWQKNGQKKVLVPQRVEGK